VIRFLAQKCLDHLRGSLLCFAATTVEGSRTPPRGGKTADDEEDQLVKDGGSNKVDPPEGAVSDLKLSLGHIAALMVTMFIANGL
jgi:hypothetical protein